MRLAVIALATAIGFVAVCLATVVGGLWMNQGAECDGVCTDMFGITGALALVLGLLGALVGGWAAAAFLDRRGARRALP